MKLKRTVELGRYREESIEPLQKERLQGHRRGSMLTAEIRHSQTPPLSAILVDSPESTRSPAPASPSTTTLTGRTYLHRKSEQLPLNLS